MRYGPLIDFKLLPTVLYVAIIGSCMIVYMSGKGVDLRTHNRNSSESERSEHRLVIRTIPGKTRPPQAHQCSPHCGTQEKVFPSSRLSRNFFNVYLPIMYMKSSSVNIPSSDPFTPTRFASKVSTSGFIGVAS